MGFGRVPPVARIEFEVKRGRRTRWHAELNRDDHHGARCASTTSGSMVEWVRTISHNLISPIARRTLGDLRIHRSTLAQTDPKPTIPHTGATA